MRNILLLLIFAGISIGIHAQTFSDCEGAIVLCGDLYTEDQASLNTGDTYEWTGTCNNGLEQSSVWYSFTVQSDGNLGFTLTPNNPADDYDWGLFNITNGGCAGLNAQDGSSPEVSCNSWGTFGDNGPTGISTAQGGVSNSGGPGNTNGPPFNADLPVSEGEVYALVVMNWSNSFDGYTIDFGESTAALYDDVSPTLISATTDCANQVFTLTFSEPIVMFSVNELDFGITGPGGTFEAIDVESQTPNANYDNVLIITLSEQISVAGTYTISIMDTGGYVEDPCGNLAINEIDIVLNDPILVETEITDACNGVNGGIEITNIEGGQAPFEVYLDNVLQNDLILDGLNAGFYEVLILDASECEVLLNIQVPDHQLTVIIPDQAQIECNNGIVLTGIAVQPQQSVDIVWTFVPGNGNIVSGENTLNPLIDEPGIYTITVTDPQDGCSYSDEIEIEQGLLDNVPPTIISAISDCGSNTIILTFSEPVVTSSVQIGDISIVGSGVNLEVTDIIPFQINSDFESQYTITLSEAVVESGQYTISFTSSSEFVLDQCGNIAVGDFDFDLFGLITFDVIPSVACNGVNGSIEIQNIEGGGDPFTFLLDNQVQNDLLAEGLVDDTYDVTIQDNHGCITETTVVIPAHFISVSVPLQDSLSCSVPSLDILGLSVSPDQEVTYDWNVAGNTGNIANGSETSSPTVNEPGVFSVTVTHVATGCNANATVLVPSAQVYGIDLSSLSFPNVVTSNSDGKNDYWSPFLADNPEFDLGEVFDNYELKIYNRWGKLLFETTDASQEWEVSDISEGSYFYTLKYAINCGDSVDESKEGIITILR